MGILIPKIAPRPVFYLIFRDDLNTYRWKVSVKFIEQENIRLNHYTNKAEFINPNTLIEITIESSDKVRNSIIKRTVMLEKKGCIKSISTAADPLMTWALQSLFNINPPSIVPNKRDFILLHEDGFGKNLSTWKLIECTLENNDIWGGFDFDNEERYNENLIGATLTIKPKQFLQAP